ncbi:MAG: acyl-CoA thioesterase [Anaerolineae bacterium]
MTEAARRPRLKVSQEPDRYRFSTHVSVRFRDIDVLGHVNNAVYFSYMEQARVRYAQEVGIGPAELGNFQFILAEESCRFVRPVRHGEDLLVRVRATEVRRSSFVLEYLIEVEEPGELAALGRTVQVWYDYQAQKAVPVPYAARDRLAGYEGLED